MERKNSVGAVRSPAKASQRYWEGREVFHLKWDWIVSSFLLNLKDNSTKLEGLGTSKGWHLGKGQIDESIDT